MPSAVFCSVTALPTLSVSAGAPSAYEPPTIVTFAVVFVSDTSSKSAPTRSKIGPESGNWVATDTLIKTPLSEMTALVGAGSGGVTATGVVVVGGGLDELGGAAALVET